MKKVLIVDDQASWRKFNTDAVQNILGTDTVIDTASSAREGYSKLLENNKEPYDYILTDLQMESDYLPKTAGEWLIEQIQMMVSYYKSIIVVVSASPIIRNVAETYKVFCISKSIAITTSDSYKEFLN